MAGESNPKADGPLTKTDETGVIQSTTPLTTPTKIKSPARESPITKFFRKRPKSSQGKEKHKDKQKTSSVDEKGDSLKDKSKEAGATKSEDKVGSEDKVQGKKAKQKRKQTKRTTNAPTQTSTLKDYFLIRRSSRKCKSDIEAEKNKLLQEAILSKKEDGLAIKDFGSKGRGVVATKQFKKGDFVVEYAGDLIDLQTAKEREEKYAADSSVGCYIYYFCFNDKRYCIDATAESGRLGRLINHSKTDANCVTKKIGINNTPYLLLVANRDIDVDEELLYDYGDRSKSSLAAHPWLSL